MNGRARVGVSLAVRVVAMRPALTRTGVRATLCGCIAIAVAACGSSQDRSAINGGGPGAATSATAADGAGPTDPATDTATQDTTAAPTEVAATPDGAPTVAQVQGAIKAIETCGGRDDGFVTCIDMAYSFGPIKRHGLMCISAQRQKPIKLYPVNMEVHLMAHMSDGTTRSTILGSTEAQTWFMSYHELYGAWLTNTPEALADAYSC